MRAQRFVPLLAVALGAGCSAPPAPSPPEKTIIDPQLQALQKAKDVQRIVDQNKQAGDQRLQDAENSPPPSKDSGGKQDE